MIPLPVRFGLMLLCLVVLAGTVVEVMFTRPNPGEKLWGVYWRGFAGGVAVGVLVWLTQAH